MKINLSADIKRATKKLNKAAKKQIPFAASKSLNEVAFTASRKVMPDKANKVFKGGATAFTRRGFKYIKSNKRRLTAIVYVDDIQAEYMQYMIKGGVRSARKRAILSTAASSKLNKYGNFTRNTVNKMLSDKKRYFKGTPKGQTPTPDNQGIYQRYGTRNKKGGAKIKMVASYKSKQQYKSIFNFKRYTEDTVLSARHGFAVSFKKNLQYALKTAR